MKIKELRSVIDMIRDASKADLIIVSLFLLPILLGSWSIFLNSINYLDNNNGWKFFIICLLFITYLIGLIQMKRSDTREKKLKRAIYHIETRLKKRGGHRASFDAIRNEVNETYTDDFLKELIDKNPEVFGTVTLKKEHKPGITLIEVESEDIR